MSSATSTPKFTTWDYVVFSAFLAVSLMIGIYHAIMARRRASTQEFLMASKSMGAIPVALSVLASFFSASTLLGTPAEVYLRGTQYWMSVWGSMFAPAAGAYLFGPLFRRLQLVSVYQVSRPV